MPDYIGQWPFSELLLYFTHTTFRYFVLLPSSGDSLPSKQ